MRKIDERREQRLGVDAVAPDELRDGLHLGADGISLERGPGQGAMGGA
jgi:hypothetical protein